jgi:hypothetical protein
VFNVVFDGPTGSERDALPLAHSSVIIAEGFLLRSVMTLTVNSVSTPAPRIGTYPPFRGLVETKVILDALKDLATPD